MPDLKRPFLGFIVEGDGEFQSYRTIVAKIVENNCCNIPIVNARGCGNIHKNLEEQLNDLVKISYPHVVIVTVDLCDLISQGLSSDCVEAVKNINDQIIRWKKSFTKGKPQMEIIPVIQIQKFETWMIADIESLISAGYISSETKQVAKADSLNNPSLWIQKNFIIPFNSKSPREAKSLFAKTSPSTCSQYSSSFNKFHREVIKAYKSLYSAS